MLHVSSGKTGIWWKKLEVAAVCFSTMAVRYLICINLSFLTVIDKVGVESSYNHTNMTSAIMPGPIGCKGIQTYLWRKSGGL